jgi:hypothetical protein
LEKAFLSRKKIIGTAVVILLIAMTAQNVYTYFVEQANNEECRLSLGLEQAMIGKTIGDLQKEYPGRFHYFIAPSYFENHVVRFLGYAGMPDSLRLDLTSITQGNFAKEKDAVFFLEENKKGVFELLKTLFPGGREAILKNSEGHVLLYRYDVPAVLLKSFQKWNRGLNGTYWNSLNEKDKPVLRRQDPVLNFTSKWDFPFENYPPFSISWKGRLTAPESGTYRIRLLTADKGSVWVDGREVFDTQKLQEEAVFLRKGSHLLRVEYQKTGGDTMALHLIWMMPQQNQWDVVPATAFGAISKENIAAN